MLEYDKIDIFEGIDVNKTDKSKKCMLCCYWYFLNKNFSYEPRREYSSRFLDMRLSD